MAKKKTSPDATARAAKRLGRKVPPKHMQAFRPPRPEEAPPMLPSPSPPTLAEHSPARLVDDVLFLGRRRAQELLLQGLPPKATDYREVRVVQTAMSLGEKMVARVLERIADDAFIEAVLEKM